MGSDFQEEGGACAKALRKRGHVAGGTESSSVWLQLRLGCGDGAVESHCSFKTGMTYSDLHFIKLSKYSKAGGRERG